MQALAAEEQSLPVSKTPHGRTRPLSAVVRRRGGRLARSPGRRSGKGGGTLKVTVVGAALTATARNGLTASPGVLGRGSRPNCYYAQLELRDYAGAP